MVKEFLPLKVEGRKDRRGGEGGRASRGGEGRAAGGGDLAPMS